MTRSDIRLDHAGIAAVLKSSGMAALVASAAEGVASSARQAPELARHEARVEVSTGTTDRAAASVTIAHPGGLGMQAKHGTLTRAAGAAGLDVTER